jgi:hypothetical protein
MLRNKVDLKPNYSLIAPSNLHEFPLVMIVGWIYAKSCQK